MKIDDSSLLLWRDVCRGDQAAATRLHAKYAARLAALVQPRISPTLGRRIDADDVVQSALGSVFVRAPQGCYSVERSGELWSLLAAIALNKLRRQAKRHTAQRRDGGREQPLDECGAGEQIAIIVDRDPTPDETHRAVELLQLVLDGLTPPQQQALQLRLMDYTLEEIAANLNRSERTVRRWMDLVRNRLARRLEPPQRGLS